MDWAHIQSITNLFSFGAGGYQQHCILHIKPWTCEKMAVWSICASLTTEQHFSTTMLLYGIMGHFFGIIMSLLAVGDATRELLGSITLLHRSPGL